MTRHRRFFLMDPQINKSIGSRCRPKLASPITYLGLEGNIPQFIDDWQVSLLALNLTGIVHFERPSSNIHTSPLLSGLPDHGSSSVLHLKNRVYSTQSGGIGKLPNHPRTNLMVTGFKIRNYIGQKKRWWEKKKTKKGKLCRKQEILSIQE